MSKIDDLNDRLTMAYKKIDLSFHIERIHDIQEKVFNLAKPDYRLIYDISKYFIDKTLPDPPRDHNVNSNMISSVKFVGADPDDEEDTEVLGDPVDE